MKRFEKVPPRVYTYSGRKAGGTVGDQSRQEGGPASEEQGGESEE